MAMVVSQVVLRRAFTLPELILGMVISSMTLTALAALALAVGQSWEDSEAKAWQDTKQAPTRSVAVQSTGMLRELVKRSKYITWAGNKSDGTGSAVFLWTKDDAQPGEMELGEVALIEYSKAAGTLTLYQVPSNASNVSDGINFSQVNGEGDIVNFKRRANVSESARVLLRNVSRFSPVVHNASDAAARASLEYVLEIGEGSVTRCVYQTATLRSPSVRPP